MRIPGAVILTSALALGLAGCGPGPLAEAQTGCMFEVNPQGSYVSENNGPFRPDAGASQAGADALNACVNRRLAAGGHSAPQSSGQKTGAPISALNTASPAPATSGPRQVAQQYSWTSGSPATVTTSTGAAIPSINTTGGSVAAAPAAPVASPAPAPNGSCALTLTGGAGYACTGN